VCGSTSYILVYVGTLQWVGLLAMYQYMLVHCSGWVYWLCTNVCWHIQNPILMIISMKLIYFAYIYTLHRKLYENKS